MNILTVNLLLSTLIFGILARVYAWPRLRTMELRAALTPILFVHAFRHLGLMFLERGATVPGMPAAFARPAAYGDFVAALLALACLGALALRPRFAVPLVWLFGIEGTVDLFAAIALATKYGAVHFMGAAYWIPALWVPALLVTHFLAFTLLLRRPVEK